MGDRKILIIGAKGFPKVHCYDWGDDSFPNIPDYDVVIINVVSLTQNIKERFVQWHIKQGLFKLLDSKGTMVAIGCPRELITAYNESNYLWCPFPLEIHNESGTSFKHQDATFKDYFNNVKKYSYCFDIEKGTEEFRYFISSQVKNRYDKYLAGIIKYKEIGLKEVPISPTGYSGTEIEVEVIHESGDFIFLPHPTKISVKEAINFILEKYLDFYQKTPPPDWTKTIEVPGLNKVQKNIETQDKDIHKLTEQKNKLQEKESDLISFKELLFETGSALENIVKKVFGLLGYKPKPPKFREEYVIKYKNKTGIIECKGNEKSIKRSDFRQLLDYTKEYEIEGKVEHKGILIGNAWRLKPLNERNQSGTPIFPKGRDGVVDIAIKNEIALLSTIDLFNAFCRFLDGKIKADDIMDRIFKAKGIVNLQF